MTSRPLIVLTLRPDPRTDARTALQTLLKRAKWLGLRCVRLSTEPPDQPPLSPNASRSAARRSEENDR